MFKEKPFNVLLFCSIVTITTAVLQYLYPQFGFLDGGLITAILLTIFLKDDLYTKIFGFVAIALIVVSTFYPNDNMDRQQVIMQHLFSGIIAVLTMISVLYVKKLYGSIEYDKQQVTALFEHATEGIILTNQRGEIVLINPAALDLFKYRRDELLGENVEKLIPGRFHTNHHQYREGFYKNPGNRSMGHGRDLFARMKDGNEIPVEVSLSFYKHKEEFFVIAFIVDITQRKESERRLIEQKEQLEKVSADIRKLNADLENKVEERTLILKEALQELEKSQSDLSEALNKEKELNEIKSRFVSTASHEFRTPLSTVLSSAALLSKYTKTEEQDKRERHIRRIKDAVKHLNDLLEDFLSLGKLEEGKVQAKAEPVLIKDFLDEVAEEMKALAKPGQQIQVEWNNDLVFNTDKKLLKNVLINLLSNAVKFSPEEGTIWLRAHKASERLIISVQDQGIGISEEDQQHLFSSFFRGKNAINIQGTGLGLHIVKGYVELLQGIIQLESQLGEGTTITLDLPALNTTEA
jgi:PAS domain S-box-containing protein